jgi:aryl-alcohol dehydrogenase-like predicted oxidoreductase
MNSGKVILGTVQFGLDYGINNSLGIPNDKELELIFATAQSNGINTFDTAIAYGNAEERIRPFLFEEANVISKFPSSSTAQSLAQELKESLERLGRNNLYAFMAHDADQLLKQPDLWAELSLLKASGLILKKGYSLYHPEQLEMLLQAGNIPDIVQVPYSLLDRRFGPSMLKLKEMGVEIHVRSVFLQGLYFLDSEKLPEKLQPIAFELRQLHNLAKQANVSISALALNFTIQNPNIDQVVIGVDSSSQLLMNLNTVNSWNNEKNTIFNDVMHLTCSRPELLNPSNWK